MNLDVAESNKSYYSAAFSALNKNMNSLRLKLSYTQQVKFQGMAFVIMLCFLGLVVLSRSTQSNNLDFYFLLMSASFIGVFGFFIYLYKNNYSLTARYVYLWALAFHLIGIIGLPLFEDDYFRYLWDAYQSVQLGSPYGVAPSEYFDNRALNQSVPEPFQAILGQINYPDIPTIYGPSLQYSFLLAYIISPGEVWPLQLVYSVFDMLLIGILLKLAKPNMVMLLSLIHI